MKNKLSIILAALLLVGFAGLATYGAMHNQQEIKKRDIQIESKDFKLQQLKVELKKMNSDYQKEVQQNTLDTQKEQEYQQKLKEWEEKYKALEVSKATEKAEKARIAAAQSKIASVVTPTASAAPQCGDNNYAHEIYMQESGCRLDVVNSIGACGIGQALPCSKLSNVCPDWRTNYTCQNQFFTSYAMQYGGWAEAYNFKYCKGSCYSARIKTTVFKSEIYW